MTSSHVHSSGSLLARSKTACLTGLIGVHPIGPTVLDTIRRTANSQHYSRIAASRGQNYLADWNHSLCILSRYSARRVTVKWGRRVLLVTAGAAARLLHRAAGLCRPGPLP